MKERCRTPALSFSKHIKHIKTAATPFLSGIRLQLSQHQFRFLDNMVMLLPGKDKSAQVYIEASQEFIEEMCGRIYFLISNFFQSHCFWNKILPYCY